MNAILNGSVPDSPKPQTTKAPHKVESKSCENVITAQCAPIDFVVFVQITEVAYLNVAGSAVYDINVHISSAASLIGMACDTDITPGSPPRQQQIGLTSPEIG